MGVLIYATGTLEAVFTAFIPTQALLQAINLGREHRTQQSFAKLKRIYRKR